MSRDPRWVTASALKFIGRERKCELFGVFRPTPLEAIISLYSRVGVGKTLSIKGKPKKGGPHAGYVPFIQVSADILANCWPAASVDGSHVRIFYKSDESMASALAYFQSLSSSSCKVLKARNAVGLEVPDTLVQQWLVTKIAEFDACKCWAHETGELAFQWYHMRALTMESDVCLLQADCAEPLNPYGCLMSLHEDGYVIAAVSDFDAFLIGSSKPIFESLDTQQVELAEWCLTACLKACQATSSSWTRAWLHLAGKRPISLMPPHGYGDKVSTKVIADLMEATKHCGRAVRHGMEAFNFTSPADFDDTYVVYWGQFASVPYRHMNMDDLCTFLVQQAKAGYHFPLNPAWMRDGRFADVFKELRRTGGQQWFPTELQARIVDAIDNGFLVPPSPNATAAETALPLTLELGMPWDFEGCEPKLEVTSPMTPVANRVQAGHRTPSPGRLAASQPSSGGRSRTPPGHGAQHRHPRRYQGTQRWHWDSWHQYKCAECEVDGLKCWYSRRSMCPRHTDIPLQHYVRVCIQKKHKVYRKLVAESWLEGPDDNWD